MKSIFQFAKKFRKVRIAEKTLRLNLSDAHERAYFESLKNKIKDVDQLIAEQFIQEGDVVLDAGANIGICSLHYLENGAKEIFSCEPHPTLFERLEKLRGDGLTPVNIALGDRNGTAKLLTSDKHNQGHTLKNQWPSIFPDVYKKHPDAHQVNIRTLDSAFPNQSFDFIKVDIEGSEPEFVSGAEKTFSENPPRVLQIEIYPEIYQETIEILSRHFKYIRRVVVDIPNQTLQLLEPETFKKIDVEKLAGMQTEPPIYLCSNQMLMVENGMGQVLTSLDSSLGKCVFEDLAFGGECLQKIASEYNADFHTVLDIGSGEGKHSDIFRGLGKLVTEIDFGESEYFHKRSDNRHTLFGDYIEISVPGQFDLIWACHVLEHQPNVHQFLRKIYSDLKDGGILAITVPPLKHEVVGGHLTVWNAGLLLYNLVIAGFDCSEARVLQYGYNISVIIRKSPVELPQLSYDKGDIEKLIQYFPPGVSEPFNGDIKELNWNR